VIAWLRFFLFIGVLSIGTVGVSAQNLAPAPVAPAPQESDAQQLDRIASHLLQIETRLRGPDLSDGDLAGLRTQVDPLNGEIQDVLKRLTPELAAAKARLDQLGPAPAANAPAESPQVTADRTAQQKQYDATDQALKRAKLLAVQAEQTANQIAGRQRDLLLNSLFERAPSPASPGLWHDLVSEAPTDAAAIRKLFVESIATINAQLAGPNIPIFWSALAAIIAVFLILRGLSRRILARTPTLAEPSGLHKILAAWWVAIIITALPLAAALAVSLLSDAFALTDERMQPFVRALGSAVLRIALTAGIARSLFALSQPAWRLIKVGTPASTRLVYLTISVAVIISATNLLISIGSLIGASFAMMVVVRGLGALMVAIVVSSVLWQLAPRLNPEDETLGPQITSESDWQGALRLFLWAIASAILVAVLIGYVTFADFLVEQSFRIASLGTLLFMALRLVDEVVAWQFQPSAAIGRFLLYTIGIHRESLDQLAVLLAGALRVLLFISTAVLVLTPFGVQSSDLSQDLHSALFGFKIGDLTISLFSIVLAIIIFAIGLAATRVVQSWLETRFLPHTHLDIGLRDAIRTSLGYIGIILAAGFALGYLGLSFEKVTIVAGALSVGIGFGLQSIVNNFVSGLILLWERAVKVGDWIVVGNDEGFVRRINVRSTEIETFDRSAVIVPNSNLITGTVRNWMRTDRLGRIKISVSVDISAEPEAVQAALLEIAQNHALILATPAPFVVFNGFTMSLLSFDLFGYIGDVETMMKTKSELTFAVFTRFKAAGFLTGGTPTSIVKVEGVETLLQAAAPNPLSGQIHP